MSSSNSTSATPITTASGITTSHTSPVPPSSSPAVNASGQTTSSSNTTTPPVSQSPSLASTKIFTSGQSTLPTITGVPTPGQSTSLSTANVLIPPPPATSTTITPTPGQPPSSSSPGHSGPSSQISPSTGIPSSGLNNNTSNSQESNNHHLSDGAVAGVAIGVGVGLALATFLVTFFFMRFRRKSRTSKRGRPGGWGRDSTDPRTVQGGDTDPESELKQPVLTEQSLGPRGPGSLESYLPQSADDKAVKNKVATLLEQVQLHVENFYHNSSSSISEAVAVELMKFDSPDLLEPLAASMRRSRNQVPLIMHCITRSIFSSIMPDTGPERSLLPLDFVALPNAIKLCKSNKPGKAGFDEAFARWRVLSAYVRPNPAEDTNYILHRDRIISELVRTFSHAFAPWQNPKYRDGESVRSLTEIMKSAADLGIWLFSQPSTFQFQWGALERFGRNTVVVAPALVKVANERAQTLSEAQVMLEMIIRKT